MSTRFFQDMLGSIAERGRPHRPLARARRRQEQPQGFGEIS